MPDPTSTEIAKREPGQVQVWRETGSVQEIVANAKKIEECMKEVMKEGEHYGVIPGTGGGKDKDGKEKEPKPSLLKPGAEKLGLLFRLRPEFQHTEVRDGNHLTVLSLCSLYHIPTGDCLVRDIAGSCSTKESKYAYRQGNRKCPKCSAETIRRGKAEFGGGWYCSAKDGGCGAKFSAEDSAITSQTVGRVANPDLADQWNTVVKMADKRSLVAATLIATAASDAFTQDLEDMVDAEGHSTVTSPQRTSGRPVPKPATVVNGGDFDPNPAPEKPAGKDAVPGVDSAANPLLGAVNDLAAKLELTGPGVANIATKLFKRTVEAKDLPGLPEADAESLGKELEIRWTAKKAQR